MLTLNRIVQQASCGLPAASWSWPWVADGAMRFLGVGVRYSSGRSPSGLHFVQPRPTAGGLFPAFTTSHSNRGHHTSAITYNALSTTAPALDGPKRVGNLDQRCLEPSP